MNTITNLEQLKNIDGMIYVRWSISFALDKKRGYSLRYGTSREAGLSCCEIDKDWDDWQILRQLTEYSFCGGYCWIIAGDEIGTGEDNEPLLANVKLIGKVGNNLFKTNWKKMQLESEIADGEERLARITDKIGIKIVSESLARSKKLLSEME